MLHSVFFLFSYKPHWIWWTYDIRNVSATNETTLKMVQAKESKAVSNNTSLGVLNLFFLAFLPYVLVWVHLLFS